MDNWSKEKRSEVMSKIRSKDTKPERIVRSNLHLLGFRFRKNVNSLPGKPDIVLKKYKTVIFVHGCFWHFHEGCNEGRIPSSRFEYWQKKLSGNKARDKRHVRDLKKLGWRVIRVWECEIEKKTDKVIKKLVKFITQRNFQ